MPKRIGRKLLKVLTISKDDKLIEKVLLAPRTKSSDHSVAVLIAAQYVRNKATLRLRYDGIGAIGKRLHVRSFVAKRTAEDLDAIIREVERQNQSSADGLEIVFSRKRGDFILKVVEMENIFIKSLLQN